MKHYLRVALSGLLISFLGTLPLGTLNLTAFDIAASQGTYSALWFCLAVILVELVVVRLTLYGTERLQMDGKVMDYLLPFGVLLLMYLSVSHFIDLAKISEVDSKIDVLPQLKSTFMLGFLLSALNPLQIPFWMTWNKVLENKGILKANLKYYSFYISGIGVGTMIGLGVFVLAGKYILTNYNDYSKVTNLLMGLLYLGFSFYLMYLFIKKRLNYKTQ